MKDDLSAPLGALNRLDAEVTSALRLPANSITGWKTSSATDDRDMVCHDKGRVKAHAKLADEGGVAGGIARQPTEELLGARAGNGAQVGNNLLPAHANTVVSDRDGSGLGIKAHPDAKIGVTLEELVVGQGLQSQLVAGI